MLKYLLSNKSGDSSRNPQNPYKSLLVLEDVAILQSFREQRKVNFWSSLARQCSFFLSEIHRLKRTHKKHTHTKKTKL